MFKTKEIKKTYWAVVKEKPDPTEGNLVHYLKKNEAQNRSKAYAIDTPGASRSELDYKLVAASTNYYLLEINPHTGRHHQIRVQLSSMGWPIKGDVKYGFKRSNDDASIHLHARAVNFIHPVSKEAIQILAPPPDEVLWNEFARMLKDKKN